METWTTAGWIPAAVLAFLISAFICLRSKENDCLFPIFLILWILIANIVVREEHKIEKVEFKQPLLSLKTIGSVEGNFFLIHSGEKYSGFIKTEKGVRKFVMSGYSEIIMDGGKYYLEVCKQEYSRYFVPFVYDDNWSKEFFSCPKNCRHEIHVPKGTIKFEFNVR